MEAHYNWSTKLFRSKYEIFSNDLPVGELKDKNWSRTVFGELNARKISFVTKGFFKKETHILNSIDDFEIGRITYNMWKTKATITYGNRQYSFQYDNFFHTKWSITNENGALIKYQSGSFKGSADAYTSDEILILTGIFIRHLFKKEAASHSAAAT